ncbi:hypothetical protein BCF59_0513 [Mycoplasmopsis mustelae]|uniref:Uncharacterized protein n=1 Tax=Mycoplasmopsis mustelae TaxID=171289 RepID=A0A4R7UEC4_9BACT|nr:hypothetical protein [Mycoplasmopsis mustelae]TDV23524.1 hypothetical protein BCF59_0513 [Mycoplasmopsis mustelae]
MAINFNIEAQATEIPSALGVGNYLGSIVNAAILRDDKGINYVQIDVEVNTPEGLKTTNRRYYIDENYKAERKRKWDQAQLNKMIIGLGLSYKNELEFMSALIKMKGAKVNVEITKSQAVNQYGHNYLNKTFTLAANQKDLHELGEVDESLDVFI